MPEESRVPKVRQVAKYVKEILLLQPTPATGNKPAINYRDNDEQLVARYWKEQILRSGKSYTKMTAEELLKLYATGILVPADDITRARRLVQEACPETRGAKYEERQSQRKKFAKEIKQ